MIKTISVFLTICYAGLSLANTGSEQTKPVKNKLQLMFYQHAGAGQMLPSPKHPNCYQLTLSKLDERVIYLSDAPARVTGTYTIPQFVNLWQHNQKTDRIRPNAFLHAKTEKNQWINSTAEFLNLQYDEKNASLSYTLCPLDKQAQLTPGQLEAISIFIDPFHPWPP